MNDRFCAILGHPREGLLNCTFTDIGSPDYVAADLDLFRRIVSGELAGYATERRYSRQDGSSIWVMLNISLVRNAGVSMHLVAVLEDITGRKQAESELRDLSGRLISAHEEERARIARELHDDMTQRLARLAIDLARAERGKDEVSPAETMRVVRESVVRLGEDIHALSYRLHPSLLDDMGLAEAMKAECERLGQQSSVVIELAVGDVPPGVPPPTALCLFRVAQEALRNVTRHARATKARVSVRPVDEGLQLAVVDDGIGYDPTLRRKNHSLGLASMRERVSLLGGQFDIDSVPGQGTTILAWVPAEGGAAMSRVSRTRVLLADDHRLVAEGLSSLLSADYELVGVVEDGRALLDAAKRLRPDVIVADISMPKLNGIDALVQLRQEDKQVRVVFLTMHPEVAYARRAFEAGALGYVLKHAAPAELTTAIDAAMKGNTYVSPAIAGDLLRSMDPNAQRAADPAALLSPPPARDTTTPCRGSLSQADRCVAVSLSAHCGVPQVSDDGDAQPAHHRRTGPLRDQARHLGRLIAGGTGFRGCSRTGVRCNSAVATPSIRS